MYRLESMSNGAEIQSVLAELMEKYQSEVVSFSNEAVLYRALHGLAYFSYEYVDEKYNVLLWFAGVLYDAKERRCWGLEVLEEKVKEIPKSDTISRDGLVALKQMKQKDYQEMRQFLIWDIEKFCEGDKEEKIGMVVGNRYKEMEESGRFLRHKSRKKQNEKLQMFKFRKKCEKFLKNYNPQKMKEYLDNYIIGQDEAKMMVCMAVYNHYLRILHPEENLVKTNVLLLGPTGCGKTEIMRRLKDILDVPLTLFNYSEVVGTQWKGKHKEDALYELLAESKMQTCIAEYGIVFLDEVDKVAGKGHMGDIGEEVQGQMLGMLEGTLMKVERRNDTSGFSAGEFLMNTKNILFICSGAFEGLEEIVAKDAEEVSGSFGMPLKKKAKAYTRETLKAKHLETYGFRSELVGRLCERAVLSPIGKEEIKRILTHAKDSFLERYKNTLLLGGNVILEFTEDALDVIAEEAIALKIGARSLNRILAKLLDDYIYELEENRELTRLSIDGKTVREKLG